MLLKLRGLLTINHWPSSIALILVFLGFYQNFALVAHVALAVRVSVVENMRLACGLALGDSRHGSTVVGTAGAGALL